MTAVQTIPPVRKQVVVDASAEHCWRVFTEETTRWWPAEHHIGKSPLKRAIIENAAGGRWYATHEDGSETTTGTVRVWDPPKRLVLVWQINADWQFDPQLDTEVEITFTPDGASRTVVVLEHRDLDKFGTRASDLRAGIDAEGGWGMFMASFRKAAEG
ncbi:MAG: SRPBCC family protein [Gemmatimonadaceae bacterium]